MAKTVHADGTSLTPTYLNAINGTGAASGHTHDGTDADGSAPNVDLTAHVTDELPLVNMVDGASGTVDLKVTTTYLTVEQTGTAVWQRIGNVVTLNLPQFLGTSTGSTLLQIDVDSDVWPADIYFGAGSSYSSVLGVSDNTVAISGKVQLPYGASSALSVVCFLSGAFSTTFTASGAKGISNCYVTYMVP